MLTKPDTLTAGATSAQQKWKAILSGQDTTYALTLGYYCTKLSDDAERARNLSRVERETLEDRFFESTAPWSGMKIKNRLGVKNTVGDLSQTLSEMLYRS